jgi:hypothetical protein
MSFFLNTPKKRYNLGNLFALMDSWGDLAGAMGDADGEFPQLLFIPFSGEEPISAEIWDLIHAQAKIAHDRYAARVGLHTRLLLNDLAGR